MGKNVNIFVKIRNKRRNEPNVDLGWRNARGEKLGDRWHDIETLGNG